MAGRKSTRRSSKSLLSGVEISRALLSLDSVTRNRIAFEEFGDLLADCLDHMLDESPQEAFAAAAWERWLITSAGWLNANCTGWVIPYHQSLHYTIWMTVTRLDDVASELRDLLPPANDTALSRYQSAMSRWMEAHGDDDKAAAKHLRWVIHTLTGRKPKGISWESMVRTVAKYHREQLPDLVAAR